MNRKETTEFLSKLLVSHRLNVKGKYYASEVTFDWGKQRVDFMEFVPQNQSTSGIEHGEFICYEVKSCKALKTMQCYKCKFYKTEKQVKNTDGREE